MTVSNEEESIPLSDRELQVLQMAATGATNQEIGRELVISVNTVKVHMRNIFEKLEVQSRTEASLRAIQEGWVTVSPEEEASSDESPIPPVKTYLVAEGRPPVLPAWQQFYLAGALILALLTAATPLLFTKPWNAYIPVRPVSLAQTETLYQSNEEEVEAPPPAAQPVASNRWTVRDSIPTERAGLGLAAFDRKIYAIGGVKTNDKATRFVEIYNPDENSWTEGATKPTAATNISSVVLNDKLYVPGGCTNDGQALDVLEIYDPQVDRWETGPPLPVARCGYGLVAFDNELYLFGGWDGRRYQDTIFLFSPEENDWEIMDSVTPAPIGYMGITRLADFIYIAGGYDGQTEFDQLYAFNPETEVWLEKAPMQEKRAGLGLVNISDQLYAVGGGWNRPLESNEKYDPQQDAWSSFETPFANQWRNLGVTVANDTEIYAVGGWNGTAGEYMDTVVSYNVLFELFLPITAGDK